MELIFDIGSKLDIKCRNMTNDELISAIGRKISIMRLCGCEKYMRIIYDVECDYVSICRTHRVPLCGALKDNNEICHIKCYTLCKSHKKKRSTIQALITKSTNFPKCLSRMVAELVIGKS